jgi:hypothetical protein
MREVSANGRICGRHVARFGTERHGFGHQIGYIRMTVLAWAGYTYRILCADDYVLAHVLQGWEPKNISET